MKAGYDGGPVGGRRSQEKTEDGVTVPQMGLFATGAGREAEPMDDGAPSLVAAPHLMPARPIPGRPGPSPGVLVALDRVGVRGGAVPELTAICASRKYVSAR